MKNLFNSVKVFKPKSSLFDLSHDVKLSCNMGQLVPVAVIECVPGDRFSLSCEALVRFAPLVAPMMHRVDVTMHYFFVPNRLLWPHWEQFITNTKIAGSLPAAPFLTIKADGSNYTALMDYLGIPDPADNAGAVADEDVNALPFAAYLKIWNEYYRDQNLVADGWRDLTDGDNSAAVLNYSGLKSRAWEHDYFTAALPFAQKGDAVEIPISGVVELAPAPVGPQQLRDAATGALVTPGAFDSIGVNPSGELGVQSGSPVDVNIDPNDTLVVNNAQTTINDLRRATALQKFLEKLARGGSRYIEVIRAMFGVSSSDKRLQRPEYITGTKAPVVIGEVLQTGESGSTPQGNMSGHGVSVTTGKYGSYFVEEHGYIMGIMSIMPKTAYQQGLPKHFLKISDPYQYYYPDFANIGEQEVVNKEVFAYTATGDETFGYVPRYAEYKFMQNRVAGEFRNTLDFWHMGRKFGSAPALNGQFIQADPTFRVFAVTDTDQDHMWCHVFNKVYARRLMPKYGTPTF